MPTFFMTRIGLQIAAIVIGAGVLLASCVVRDRKIEARGAEKLVAASKKEGVRANAVNSKVRDRARQPGSFERLLSESCRDCERP